jgi:hypothetical protein
MALEYAILEDQREQGRAEIEQDTRDLAYADDVNVAGNNEVAIEKTRKLYAMLVRRMV